MMETMMEHVASVLGMAPDLVREVNMYKKGDTTLAGQYLEFCNVKEVLDSIKVHDA
jgi:xanthine dehydrogenase molybdopterin-binding subunit B